MAKAWDKGGTNRHQQGYGSAWEALRRTILERDKGLCQECLRNGIPKAGNHCDHIKPKAKGGTDDPANLQTLCRPCHDRKTIIDKGHKPKRKVRFDVDGWPIEE